VRSYRTFTFLLIVALSLFHLWFIASGRWPLSGDEAHYWEWSRRLDWSYYSKGPMVAYLIALGTRLAGSTALGVRLPAILLAAGLAAIAALLASRLFQSARAGLLSVLILSVIPLYAVGSVLMTIDPPFVFCWTLAAYCLSRATRRRSEMAWYGAGIAFGLGLLSKYTMAMLAPCTLLWLLTSPRLRPWLRRREPYEAALLGLLIFSPVVVWNLRHGMLSGRHVLTQAGMQAGGHTLSLRWAGEFLGSQLLLVSPLLFLLLGAAAVWAWREGERAGREELRLLVCLSVPVFLFFQAWSLASKVQANWAAHAYVTAAVALAGWAETWGGWGSARRRTRRLNALLLASIILPAAALPLAFFPELLGIVGGQIPASVDLVAKRLRGWPELGQAVGEVMREAPQPPFLMSDRYQLASELAFYVPGQPRVFNPNLGRRMNQYDLWGGWEALRGRDGLLVVYGTLETPTALREAFAQVELVRQVPIRQDGRLLRTFTIFRGRDFLGFPPRAFDGY
jgi:4-amino-4-deoxy-L-arabinose transferase-like glycosyltransferase